MVYAGFRDARWDIQDPPPAESALGAALDPHDEEHMDARPDQEEMEEAINNFLQQLDKQEKKALEGLQGPGQPVVSVAQACKPGSVRSISVPEAIEAGFLPEPDEAHGDMFTPSELRLYRHAQDHRLTRDISC